MCFLWEIQPIQSKRKSKRIKRRRLKNVGKNHRSKYNNGKIKIIKNSMKDLNIHSIQLISMQSNQNFKINEQGYTKFRSF